MKSREKQGQQRRPRHATDDFTALARPGNRAELEELMRLAIHLNTPDRDLLAAVYNDGIPLRRIGRILGIRSQATLARRVRRALDRLTNPLFRQVLGARNHWPAERRAVAELVLLRGVTNRQAADELGLSLHRVRQHLAAIKAVLGERVPSAES